MPVRVAIGGVPRAGKTTLSNMISSKPRRTDEIAFMGWSEASAHAAEWFNEPGPWVVEGVAVVRALRKWLAANPAGKPCDYLVWLGSPWLELSKGQATMAKGCFTVWSEVKPQLKARGVIVIEDYVIPNHVIHVTSL